MSLLKPAEGPYGDRQPSLPNTGKSLAKAGRRAGHAVLALAVSGVMLLPASYGQNQPLGSAASLPTTQPADESLQPVSVDDPQAADPFAADPFAADAVGPATRPVDVTQSDVTYDAAADTVEIHVSDANLLDVLRMLSVQSQKNIVASKEVHGTVTCNLFDVTVEEALDAILRANGFVSREEGNFIYVYTQDELAAIEEQNRQQETRVFRVYHMPPEMAAAMIKPTLSEGAILSFSDETESGIGSDKENAGGYTYASGDTLVIRDFPERLDEVNRLLQEVDQRPEQVLVEATILSTKLTENNAFGVDFNVVGGVDFNSVIHNGSQITGAGLPEGTGPMDAHSVGTGNSFTDSIDGGLKVGFVSNNVSAFVAALEGITDTTVLANPKVLALNKQRGEVLVGREDGYITTTITETAATQEVDFLETGTRLIFRPYISRDGYIRLEIHPEDSAGGLNVDGLPFKSTTEVTSNVMVKDGHTIVIGGLFRESSTINRSQVPVLGNIPVVGALFRRQADETVREEIIILLTPHVIKDHDKYSELSELELQRAEKLRVGIRKGMMPTGRERMSQTYYEKAVRELASDNPNRGRARFYLNAAISLNPTFIEAIELKEKLTGRIVVEADQSTIRSFVRRSALDDVRLEKPDDDPVIPEPRDLLPTAAPVGPTTAPATESGQALVATPATQPVRRPEMQPEAQHVMQDAARPTTQPTTRPGAPLESIVVDADE